jgi:hypothetical protein
VVERFDRLAVEEPYDPLLKLARTLALNDLDQRRLLGNCLVDDGAKRALDLLALVVDAVQVELHPDAVIVPLRQRGCQAGDRAAAVEDGRAPGYLVLSSRAAPAAFLRIDSMPFIAAALVL